MNGLGLLVAIAALGVDVGWETGPGGRLLYTIRIEPVLLQPLRDGQAVVTTVDANDRALRRFQVVMGPKQGAAAGNRAPVVDASRPETMVQYGWRTGEDGGVDYLVQMTPERLETLSSGQPLIGDVDPQVTEIRRIYVYAGVGEVPRTALPNPSARQPEAPSFLGADPSIPAAPPISRPRIEAPRDGSSVFPQQSQPSSGQLLDNRDGSWRNDNFGSAFNGAGRGNDASAWTAPYNDPRNAPGYGDPRNNASWGGRQDSQLYPVGYDQRANPVRNNEPPPSAPPVNYAQRPATDAPVQPASPPAAQTNSAPAAATPLNWQTAPTAGQNNALTRASEEEVRPWTPLILTTLALFASLGANAYLGWLSWSFFWRYRDAVTDLARTRTSTGIGRQAA